MLGHRVLQIRWTAIDTHFGPRPIEIMYQRLPGRDWYAVTDAPLPNTGRYDWRLPTDVDGSVALRVIVRDRGGHRVNSEAQVLEVAVLPSVSPSVPEGFNAPTLGAGFVNEGAALSGSLRAKERAGQLFTEAVACGARGEYREGIARLREVVRLDPQRAAAFAGMGDMLYRIGDFDRALNAYDLALRQQPTMRRALRGAAKVHRQRNDLAAAAGHLRTILRHNPNDAEVWVNLGDVAVYQGDDVLARECYARATRIDPTATEAIDSARKRLALMTEVSRTYYQDGK
jgi:hypothetical protein